MLADQGAEIVRIDPPGGPRWKSPAMEALNRRKKTTLLDLKSDADLETARRLIAAADVLIENFRPGVMARLGLGWEVCDKINPNVILCQLDAFGGPRRGPRSDHAGYDDLAQAMTGIRARDVLRSLGYDEEAITSLIDRAVVSDSWSEDYLPD